MGRRNSPRPLCPRAQPQRPAHCQGRRPSSASRVGLPISGSARHADRPDRVQTASPRLRGHKTPRIAVGAVNHPPCAAGHSSLIRFTEGFMQSKPDAIKRHLVEDRLERRWETLRREFLYVPLFSTEVHHTGRASVSVLLRPWCRQNKPRLVRSR
jgi:hypothetical protein